MIILQIVVLFCQHLPGFCKFVFELWNKTVQCYQKTCQVYLEMTLLKPFYL